MFGIDIARDNIENKKDQLEIYEKVITNNLSVARNEIIMSTTPIIKTAQKNSINF